MSNTFKDLSSLSSVSENLLQLLQFRLVYGGNKLFTLQLMEKWMSQSLHTDKLEKIQRDIDQFIIALNSMNRPLIRKLLRRFFKNLQVLPSPKEILLSLQSFCIRILNDVIMQNRFRFNDEVIEEGFLLSNMNMATTFSELENKVNEWVQLITEELNSIQKANGFNRIEIAKRWILENLEKQITVEKIAQQVYLNPTYLCEVFKTETGETILDFVTKARISKAKYLLENSNLKIYEVAQKVGYSDTKYFSKLFKRHHGILPSTIKELKIKKELEAEK
ncbi:YesN/AraC family two-component response regulator [Gracilibacillus halotolerans]|uniref:YesN/AraC family two-component response regulator n=1 Tax=Gracilibacillus halotolerans TaxID=74386 RepID=A0A841RLS8_9BACI|nr:AraC family transcriptional regulator [Gracilibacillus halotolerans]MBB6512416.1 YesN/AraC family two-component response regulator [Gracilibacillus halotolerans]